MEATARSLPYELKRPGVVITAFFVLYVALFYIPTFAVPELLARAVLYLAIATTFIKLILRQTSLKITGHSVWLLIFGVWGMVSSLYALAPSYVFRDLYTLFITWILSFSFIQYVDDVRDFRRLFSIYAYAPYLLAAYLMLNNGLPGVPGERLGDSLFGNANRIATYLMISLFCIFWFVIYADRKYTLVNIVSTVVILYITALTGGRKYLIVPLYFFMLLVVFRNWKSNKSRLLLFLAFFFLALVAGIWAVINIPTLYHVLGVRFEGFLGIFRGDLGNPDPSTVVRYMMIQNGWNWFTQKPIFGYGLNNFAYMFAQVRYDVYAHNNYIELMVDLGMAGILLYYSFYAFLIAELIKIRDDETGLRNFFLAFTLALLVFEIGGITYQYAPIQVFIGLASGYVWLYKRGKIPTALEHTEFSFSY